jgi:hypothetical protein
MHDSHKDLSLLALEIYSNLNHFLSDCNYFLMPTLLTTPLGRLRFETESAVFSRLVIVPVLRWLPVAAVTQQLSPNRTQVARACDRRLKKRACNQQAG